MFILTFSFNKHFAKSYTHLFQTKMLQELCAAFLFPSQLPENRYCTSSWTLKAGCWLPFPLQHASSYWLLCIFFLNFLWGSCKSNCVYPAEFVISADFHRTSGLWINFECHRRQGHRPWSCNFGGALDSGAQWWCAQLGYVGMAGLAAHLRHLSTKKQKARFDSIWQKVAAT